MDFRGHPTLNASNHAPSIDSTSDTDSTESEERLKRLFDSCDRNSDGYIDSQDLLEMCKRLNMEEAFNDMIHQLHLDQNGQASFQDFLLCRQRLMDEIEQEKVACTGQQTWLNTDSDQSSGLPASSQDYDSGARDMSPEPAPSLCTLLERHNPDYLVQINNTQYGPGFLEIANMLHLAAVTSLRTEVIELTHQLSRVRTEKQQLEQCISRQRVSSFCDSEQALRYEDRITELHSVIAELRRKLDARNYNVIREEAEEEESSSAPARAEEESASQEHATEQGADTSAGGLDWETEMSHVISTFNRALNQQQYLSPLSGAQLLQPGNASPIRTRSPIMPGAVSPQHQPIRTATSPVHSPIRRIASPQSPSHPQASRSVHSSASSQNICAIDEQIQYTADSLQEQILKQEDSLEKTTTQLRHVQEERDQLQRKVRELQIRLHNVEAASGGEVSSPTSPLKSPVRRRGSYERSFCEQSAGPKKAELKKLKTSMSEEAPKPVLGVDITAADLQTARVAEHLVQNMLECSNVQEIVQSASQTLSTSQYGDNKVAEFEMEVARLQSQIKHLRAQNDLLALNLAESKGTCNHLTVLIGRYESNQIAMQLAASTCDQLLEAQEALILLLDSQQSVLLANCKAAGLGSATTTDSGMSDENDELSEQLHKANVNRKGAEHIIKQLLQRLDKSSGHVESQSTNQNTSAPPWEELSSTSRTNSTTSSLGSTSECEFSKLDERRVREHIKTLRHQRHNVQATVQELESVHIDNDDYSTSQSLAKSAHLDLENAVLMQELTALQEDKAELKAQHYLLTKEKATLQLQLTGKESREQAYLVQIEHLRSEVTEWKHKLGMTDEETNKDSGATPCITLAELRAHGLDASQDARDLTHALRREEALRKRVSELMATLDRLSKNAESRHKQSAEFVNDLKKANSALVSAFEKAKKKYQVKVKKMEDQLEETAVQYRGQIVVLQERLNQIESQKGAAVT